MGFRYGELSEADKLRGVRERSGPRPTTRDKRIRRGDDSISEAVAGIEREPEEMVPVKDYVGDDGEWVD